MCSGALLLKYVAVGLTAGTGRAAAVDPVAILQKGNVLLRADCFRFRKGSSNYEGLGSMFRDVRGIYYLAHILGMNTTIALNVPTTGHGGDFDAKQQFLMGPHNQAFAKDLATTCNPKSALGFNSGAPRRLHARLNLQLHLKKTCEEQMFAFTNVLQTLKT